MKVSLAHSSVKTFLTSDWIQQSPVAEFMLGGNTVHKKLMRTWLTYLCFAKFQNGCKQSAFACHERPSKYPLLAYAVENWAFHTKKYWQRGLDAHSVFSSDQDPS